MNRTRARSRWLVSGAAALVVMALAGPAVASAQLAWEKTYDSGLSVTSAIDIATDPSNGHVYVLAQDDCCPLASYDTIAYSSSGATLWHHASSTAEDLPAAIVVDAATHDVLVTGSRNLNAHSMYTINYSSSGTVLWAKKLTGAGRDISVSAIADDGHGRAIVTGTSSAGGVGDYLTTAFRISDGKLLWHIRYDGPDGNDEAVAVATDPAKNAAYVTGTSQGTNNGELTTVAYSTSTGAQKWVARDTGGTDVPRGIAVDTTNHQVYALTYTAGAHLGVFAYAPSGTALWNTGDDDPHAVAGIPEAITVDSANDRVYVAAENETATTTQTLLAAFNSSGALAWSQVVHHGANDVCWDVTADPNNHRVYVAGEQQASDGNLEFATYAETSSGTSAWTATHGGSAPRGAAPATITVDPSRKQVYVAGYTTTNDAQVLDTLAYHT